VDAVTLKEVFDAIVTIALKSRTRSDPRVSSDS